MLTSGLTHARDNHARILRSLMTKKLFEDTVRVEGFNNVDKDTLVRSRTLPHLVREEL